MAAASNSGDPPDQHIFEGLTDRVPPSPSLVENYLVEHTSLPRPLAKQTAKELNRSGGTISLTGEKRRSKAIAVSPKLTGTALATIPQTSEVLSLNERRSLAVDAGASLGGWDNGRLRLPHLWFRLLHSSEREMKLLRVTVGTGLVLMVMLVAYTFIQSGGLEGWRPIRNLWSDKSPAPVTRTKPRITPPTPETRNITRDNMGR